MAKIESSKTELVWPGKYNGDGRRKEVMSGLPQTEQRDWLLSSRPRSWYLVPHHEDMEILPQ
jgi:hypothetical protein